MTADIWKIVAFILGAIAAPIIAMSVLLAVIEKSGTVIVLVDYFAMAISILIGLALLHLAISGVRLGLRIPLYGLYTIGLLYGLTWYTYYFSCKVFGKCL